MATIGKGDLPQKEAQLFKQVVKYYESKQYKKGLRAADQVQSLVVYLANQCSNVNLLNIHDLMYSQLQTRTEDLQPS